MKILIIIVTSILGAFLGALAGTKARRLYNSRPHIIKGFDGDYDGDTQYDDNIDEEITREFSESLKSYDVVIIIGEAMPDLIFRVYAKDIFDAVRHANDMLDDGFEREDIVKGYVDLEATYAANKEDEE